jgi:hypothetical protein
MVCREDQVLKFDGRDERESRRESQATTPKSAPTPAVNAIASAPQKVTRTVATSTGAPPALADSEPNSARNRSQLPLQQRPGQDWQWRRFRHSHQEQPPEASRSVVFDVSRLSSYGVPCSERYLRASDYCNDLRSKDHTSNRAMPQCSQSSRHCFASILKLSTQDFSLSETDVHCDASAVAVTTYTLPSV